MNAKVQEDVAAYDGQLARIRAPKTNNGLTPEQSRLITQAIALLMEANVVNWKHDGEDATYGNEGEYSVGANLEIRLYAKTEAAPTALIFFDNDASAVVVPIADDVVKTFDDVLADAER
jgi:hypothetical protein